MAANQPTEFVKNIQKWVAIDTQLHEIHEKTKKLREARKEVAEIIHKHVEENNMQKTVINISDGELKFCEKKEYHALTLTYIEQCLNHYLKNDLKNDLQNNTQQVANIMQCIKSNRPIKTVKDISRNYKKINETKEK